MSSNSNLFYQRGEPLAVGIVFLLFSCGQLFVILQVWGKLGAEGVRYSEVVKVDRFTSAIIAEWYVLNNEALMLMTVLVLAQLLLDVILIHGVSLPPTQSSTARCCIFAWLVHHALLFGTITLVVAYLQYHVAREDTYKVSIQKIGAGTIGITMMWYGWTVELWFYQRLRSAETEAVFRDWELAELKALREKQVEKAPTEKQAEMTPTKVPQDENQKVMSLGEA